jgi:predicted enzyme related to lactoylglutathione lyase
MMRALEVLPTLLTLLLATGAASDQPPDPRQAHGTFTGEIKPVLYVSDVEKSAPFYRDVLGFDFQGFANADGQPYYAEFAATGVKFGLHEPMTKSQEPMVGRQRLYFRVRDLLAHRFRVLAWGGAPEEIKTTAWMDMFLVRDPDGNEIVFAVTDPARHRTNPWNTQEPAAAKEQKDQ